MNAQQQLRKALSQGDFNYVIQNAKTLIDNAENEKQSIEFRYILAVAFRLKGELQQAIKVNTAIIQVAPEHARAHQELGYLYAKLGDTLASADNFYQATQRNPALLASWKSLVQHYAAVGNKAALDLANAQIQYLSNLPPPVLQARDLMNEGQLYEADKLCRQYLQKQKHDKEGLTLLAEIGIALKIYGEAEFLLESCLALHPEHVPAGIEYVKLLSKMGKFKQALDVAENLLEKRPDNPVILTTKATALVGIGEIEQAISIYLSLLDTHQQHSLHLLLGHAYKAKGDLAKAIDSYQQAYKINPSFGDAYWSLANTKTYKFSENEIAAMQTQLKNEISSNDQIHFCFALGKAFEDRKDYVKSFHFYHLGNEKKNQSTGYRPEFIEQQVINQKRVFNPELFKRFADVGCPQPDPIFIVGLPRAGSTLLEQILASHSQVDGTMELHNIIGLVARLRGQQNRYPDIINELNPEYFAKFGEQYLKETQVYRDSAPFFIDKMPNNFMFIGLIKLILPKAKIIDARREPMACCFSGFKQLFGEGQEFTYGLENISKYYNSYLEMMEHWDQVLPGHVLRVQHEDVINDLEGQVKRILEYCNLPFEQACIEYYKTERTIKTPSSEQVRQPIFKDSMQQWKHYEAFLQPLKDILKLS
ncbi:tetratricopeptide repeat-containing sulfotransferase family protein [Glaciecola sp. 1036]|uniref:tetratricopeptide repeat-containing sulfotransferase family protein n=1 Tax=Alteromonadaceae TaxID=72275 RepID=UPI003D008C2F